MQYGFKEMLAELQASQRIANRKHSDVYQYARHALDDAVADFNLGRVNNLFRIMSQPVLIIGLTEPPISIEIGWLQRRANGEDVDEESLGSDRDKESLAGLEKYIIRYLEVRLGLDPNQIRIIIDPGLFGK